MFPLVAALNTTNPTTTPDYIQVQWVNPSEIFSVLLLLGPDIIRRAVAQLSGRRIAPVVFSFGWVAYSAHALLAVVADGPLMPDTDTANTTVIGAQNEHVRFTKSWILGKLLHDLDNQVDKEMKNELPHVPPGSTTSSESLTGKSRDIEGDKPWEALRISVFETIDEPGCVHGVPHLDWVWCSGFAVLFLQLVIAIIPLALHRQWGTLLITVYGNALALCGSSLQQWREEKWACPKKGSATVTLTRGNGSRHAMLILGKKGVGLDLEILALGTRTVASSRFSQLVVLFLAANWITLLITAAGLKPDTWYLLGIGALGSIQNVIAAAAPRQPNALGIHIREIKRLRGSRVADVLKMAEQEYPGVGLSLVPVFFPGSMRVKESEFGFWREAQERRSAPNKWGTRIDSLLSSLPDVRTNIERLKVDPQ